MKRFLFAALTAASLAACSNDVDTSLQENAVPLTCQFTPGWIQGRYMIEENILNGYHAGITIAEDGNSLGNYFGKTGYYNIEYSCNLGFAIGMGGIGLYKGKKAWVYAYCPYTSSIDVNAIPVFSGHEYESRVQDYLYGRSTNEVDGDNPVANITMNHALSVVKVVIQRESYAETGTVNNITISGTGFAATAKLNIQNGTFNDLSTEPATLTSTDSYVLPLKSQEPHITQYLIIPNGKEAPLNLSVNIDGKERTARSEPVTFLPGHKYSFIVKVNEDGNVVGTVNIKEWGYDEQFNPTALVNRRRVTIEAAEGIAVQTERTMNTLKVTAINYGSEAPIKAEATGHTIQTVPFEWGGIAERGIDITVDAPLWDTWIKILPK